MVGLVNAKKIMGSIPEDTLLNFPHPGKKLVIEYSSEDANYYLFDILAIPKSLNPKTLTEAQKEKYAMISWRISKKSGLAEEWTE